MKPWGYRSSAYRLNDLTFGVFDSWVCGADMSCELLVAPLFVLTFHLVDRATDGRTCHLEHPCAFRATPAPKILSFDPYQFAAHRLQGTPPIGVVRPCGRRRGIGFHRDDKAAFS